MLIGVLSDIHGNSTALKKVLDEARDSGVEHLFVLGDLVGYYYDAKGVYELLEDWNKNVVRGNHEDMLVGIMEGTVDRRMVKEKYGSGLDIALKNLSVATISEMKTYQRIEHLYIGGVRAVIAHGAPWDTNEYVYPDADVNTLERCEQEGIDFVFLGHTHYPFIYEGRKSTIVNPGSVGQSRVRGGVADWGILDTHAERFMPRKTPYDTKDLKQMVKETDPDVHYLHSILDRSPA